MKLVLALLAATLLTGCADKPEPIPPGATVVWGTDIRLRYIQHDGRTYLAQWVKGPYGYNHWLIVAGPISPPPATP